MVLSKLSKRTVFLILGGVVLFFIIGIGVFFLYKNIRKDNNKNLEPPLYTQPDSNEKKEEVMADTVYTDQAGFSFKYPSSLKAEDVTPKGDEYYSQVDLARSDGKLTITMKDTKFQTVEEWLNKDTNAPKNPSLIGASVLGGVPIKQYNYLSPKSKFLVSVGIDQGVLYLIESPADGGYWEGVHTALISSFAFAGSKSSTTAPVVGDDTIYEEEEIVE